MDTVHECDRQTDRITITNTVQRIASHGKNQHTVAIQLTKSHIHKCIRQMKQTRNTKSTPSSHNVCLVHMVNWLYKTNYLLFYYSYLEIFVFFLNET